MRSLVVFSFIMAFSSLGFAATTAANCTEFFNSYYEAFERAYSEGDNDAIRSVQRDIENEHFKIVREHNEKVTAGEKDYYIYPMAHQYIGENVHQENSSLGHVTYFDEKDQKLAQVQILNGKLYQKHELLTTGDEDSFNVVDWDVVMDGDGNIYIFKGQTFEIHHSSVLNGMPVAAAGMIRVLDGEVHLISSQTGHYMDETSRFILQLEKELEKQGVDLSQIGRDYQRGARPDLVAGNASHLYNIPVAFFGGLIPYIVNDK